MTNKPPKVALYLRVSTKDQTNENQLQALTLWANSLGWQEFTIYEDVMSGASPNRPGFDELTKAVTRKQVDIIMAWSIDRLGRSLQELLAIADTAKKNGITLMFHREAVDTSTPAGQLFFTIAGAFAQFERERIRERVAAGLDRARAQGKTLGRPKKYNKDTEERVIMQYGRGLGPTAIAKNNHISRTMVYRILQDNDVAIGANKSED